MYKTGNFQHKTDVLVRDLCMEVLQTFISSAPGSLGLPAPGVKRQGKALFLKDHADYWGSETRKL